MANIFLDTDVCIDFLVFRKPFYDQIDQTIAHIEAIDGKCIISESSIPNLIYVLSNTYKVDQFERRLSLWIDSCDIISSNKEVIIRALHSDFKDKEDACQYFTSLHNGVDYFITRNKKDYDPYVSSIPVYTPSEFLELYAK